MPVWASCGRRCLTSLRCSTGWVGMVTDRKNQDVSPPFALLKVPFRPLTNDFIFFAVIANKTNNSMTVVPIAEPEKPFAASLWLITRAALSHSNFSTRLRIPCRFAVAFIFLIALLYRHHRGFCSEQPIHYTRYNVCVLKRHEQVGFRHGLTILTLSLPTCSRRACRFIRPSV